MIDSDRKQFDAALDGLAEKLRVTKLEEADKFDFWLKLKHLSPDRFLKVIDFLWNNYRPFGQHHFPVLAEFKAALDNLATQELPARQIFQHYPCRCCQVTPHDNGNLACECNLTYCFQCGFCGQHCGCECGPVALENLTEWKALKKQLGMV